MGVRAVAGNVVRYENNDVTGGIGILVNGEQVAGVGSPIPFTSRALTNADNGQIFLCATEQTATVNTGLIGNFGCTFIGPVLFNGTSSLTDDRSTGATNKICALTRSDEAADTYTVYGKKA